MFKAVGRFAAKLQLLPLRERNSRKMPMSTFFIPGPSRMCVPLCPRIVDGLRRSGERGSGEPLRHDFMRGRFGSRYGLPIRSARSFAIAVEVDMLPAVQ